MKQIPTPCLLTGVKRTKVAVTKVKQIISVFINLTQGMEKGCQPWGSLTGRVMCSLVG